MKNKIKKAIISLSDKSELKSVLKTLKKYNIKIISSGGTSKEIKRLGIGKIVYVDAFGGVNKVSSRDYHTDYICPGYKEYARINVRVD